MKKFLSKLIVYSLVSIGIISFTTTLTLAAGPEELTKAFDNINDKQCIVAEKPDDKDNGYLITIIEEPLSLEQSDSRTPTSDFESRICFRNYLSYTNKGEEKVISILATECAPIIVNNTAPLDEDTIKEYKVSFSCKPVQVLLSKGGTSLIEGYIATIYKWAASIVGLIATAVIIISGVQISIAGGDTQAIENAKNRIMQSISGIIVLFLSGLILYTINPTFFTQ